MPITINRYAAFAWGTLLLNIFVILWGAFVRATGSGAGCGSHWPSCNGEVIPWSAQTETLIEFTHRITSGLALIAVVILLVWAMRSYPKGHVVRLGAKLSLAFLILEALLGAGLVLFELVAYNDSVTRAVVGALHLVNTFLLMASLGLTAWWASGNEPPHWSKNRKLLLALAGGLAGVVVLSSFGTIASLASTIFPSESFFEGVQKDFARNVHYLIRLRIWHPIIAVLVGGYLLYLGRLLEQWCPDERVNKLHNFMFTVFLVQFGMGAMNAILLTPVWLQLVHLLGAHLLWLGMVLLNVTALAVARPAEYRLAPS